MNTYIDRYTQKEGHLVVFDRRGSITWDEKIFRKQKMYNNKTITIWGM
jgi:aspartate 1-decarboxylase